MKHWSTSWKSIGKAFLVTFVVSLAFAVIRTGYLIIRYDTGQCLINQTEEQTKKYYSYQCSLDEYLENSFWHFFIPFIPVLSIYAIPYPLMFFFLLSVFTFHGLSKEKQNLTDGTTLPQTGKRKSAVWYKFFVGMFLLNLIFMFVESMLHTSCRYGQGFCLDFGPIFLSTLFFLFVVLPGTFTIMFVEYFVEYWHNRKLNDSSSGAEVST